MAISPREIKRRIKGVTNTKQITKTMEMVAASSMRRAQNSALQTRLYAEEALEILVNLSGQIKNFSHPLLKKREVKKITLILITSDRGLCGALNTNVINRAHQSCSEFSKEKIEVITVGKRGRDSMLRLGYQVVADFSGLKKIELADVLPVIKLVLTAYEKEKTDQVILAYNHFISTLVQKPVVKNILPLDENHLLKIASELAGEKETEVKKHRQSFAYKFEPSPVKVLSKLIPHLVEMQIFQAALESLASEHSARMVAMKNATEAAEEIISDLALTYNQARQAAITNEIAEIAAGAEALS